MWSTAFDRSFKHNYKQKRKVATVESGQEVDTQGRRVAINEVRVIPRETADTPVLDMRGRALRDHRINQAFQPYTCDLWDVLGDQELAAASEEFTRAKPSTLILFSRWLKLYPSLFAATG